MCKRLGPLLVRCSKYPLFLILGYLIYPCVTATCTKQKTAVNLPKTQVGDLHLINKINIKKGGWGGGGGREKKKKKHIQANGIIHWIYSLIFASTEKATGATTIIRMLGFVVNGKVPSVLTSTYKFNLPSKALQVLIFASRSLQV